MEAELGDVEHLHDFLIVHSMDIPQTHFEYFFEENDEEDPHYEKNPQQPALRAQLDSFEGSEQEDSYDQIEKDAD